MRSKTTSRIRIHFFPRPREAKPFTRFTRRFLAFGLGIFAKRLRWRPERNPSMTRALTKKTSCFKIGNRQSAFANSDDSVQEKGRPVPNQRSGQAQRLRTALSNPKSPGLAPLQLGKKGSRIHDDVGNV